MRSLTKYIHIGYPKTLSTTLQRSYFDAHPDLFHLGIGCGSNIGYRNADIHKMVEPYLTTCRDAKYQEVYPSLKKALEQALSEAEHLGFKASGISNEMLAFSPPDHIDSSAKATRLKQLFGEETRIIIIIREQFSLLKSLYKEFVRQGISQTWVDFLRYLFMFQDRSFLYDLLYDRTYARYAEFFGPEHILIFPIEAYLTPTGTLIPDLNGVYLHEKINSFLGVRNISIQLNHHNPSLSDVQTEQKRLMNVKYPHDFGRDLFTAPFVHRLQPYLQGDIGLDIGDDAYKDVRIKRHSLEQCQEEPTNPVVDFSIPLDLKHQLENLFAASNQSLDRLTKVWLTGYSM